MLKNLFRPDSGLMVTMTWITDCLFLSMFWMLGCIPVVTVGTSFAALYDASFRAFRKGERHSWQRFWHVYRENWKPGILPTILFLAASALVCKALISAWNSAVAQNISWGWFAAVAFLCAAFFGILSVLFPVLSRFENSLAGLLKNTVLLALANLPRTLGLGLINAGAVLLCIRFVIPVFLLPSLAALLGSLLLEPMFRPYMPDENAAE